MKYDHDKVDDCTLALLYLVAHDRQEGFGARAWKGFDWDTLDRLHEKGFISNPIGKTKSVGMTEEGFLKAKALFEKHFVPSVPAADKNAIPFPRMTAPAKKRWSQIPESTRKDLLDNVWCVNCRTAISMQLRTGAIEGRSLVLRGTCKQCGGDVARVIEQSEE